MNVMTSNCLYLSFLPSTISYSWVFIQDLISFIDSSAIFVEDCIQLFGTINNKILTVIEDETIASLYMNLLALVYKDQSGIIRF